MSAALRVLDGLVTVVLRVLGWTLGLVAGGFLLWIAGNVLAPMPATAAVREVQLVGVASPLAAAGPPNPSPAGLVAADSDSGDAGGDDSGSGGSGRDSGSGRESGSGGDSESGGDRSGSDRGGSDRGSDRRASADRDAGRESQRESKRESKRETKRESQRESRDDDRGDRGDRGGVDRERDPDDRRSAMRDSRGEREVSGDRQRTRQTESRESVRDRDSDEHGEGPRVSGRDDDNEVPELTATRGRGGGDADGDSRQNGRGWTVAGDSVEERAAELTGAVLDDASDTVTGQLANVRDQLRAARAQVSERVGGERSGELTEDDRAAFPMMTTTGAATSLRSPPTSSVRCPRTV